MILVPSMPITFPCKFTSSPSITSTLSPLENAWLSSLPSAVVDNSILIPSGASSNFSSSVSDSSFLILYNSNNAEIFNIYINGETTSISEIAIEYIGNPGRIELVSKKLNCLLDLQLIRQ